MLDNAHPLTSDLIADHFEHPPLVHTAMGSMITTIQTPICTSMMAQNAMPQEPAVFG
jgi:hypothetical protein